MADPPDTEAQAPPQPMPARAGQGINRKTRLRDQAAENPCSPSSARCSHCSARSSSCCWSSSSAPRTSASTTPTTAIDGLEDRFASWSSESSRWDLRLTAQIAALDLKLTAQIAELDRKLTALIAEQDRKLTALIAALNATGAVDRRLEGRLLPSDADDRDSQPGREPPEG